MEELGEPRRDGGSHMSCIFLWLELHLKSQLQGRRRRWGQGCPDPRTFYNRGVDPRTFHVFSFFFLSNVYDKLRNIYVYKIKWPKTEEIKNLGVGSFQVMTPTPALDDPDPPLENPWRRHCPIVWKVTYVGPEKAPYPPLLH